ncbi:MAG: hypothetical protein J6039_06495, partial [Alphaproteobacteria bacterium]|nr:hypothetical protein [Alphaproteobacteria bacterium]
MKINKLKILILLLLFGIFLIIPQPSFADEEAQTHPCSKEEVDNALKDVREKAAESLKDMLKQAKKFNRQAQSYISNCNRKVEYSRKPLRPTERELAVAEFVGVDISDDELYQYTAVNWSTATPAKLAANSCKDDLHAVRTKYDKFVRQYKQAMLHLSAADPEAARCTCNDDGTATQCITMDAAKEEMMAKNGKCYAFTTYHQRFASCPLCKIFQVILITNAQVAHISWNAVADALSRVVITFFLVVLALETLKAVAAVGGMQVGTYLKSVLTLGLKIAITVILLSNSSYIYNLFISPVMEGGLDMGMEIAQASGAGAECAKTSSGFASIPSQEFSPSLFDSVINTVRCFGSSAAITPAIGQGLMCNAWAGNILNKSLSMWLAGLFMFLFGLMIWLAISFYILDCTVQLGMLSALVPLFIACWPFGMTKSYTTKGLGMFMNSFFNYAMMGVVLLLGTIVINQSVTGGENDIGDLIDALNNSDLDALKKMAALDGMQLLTLIACSIFALKLIGTANDIADSFAKGAGSSIGNRIAGVAADAGTKLAKNAAKTAGGAAAKIGSGVMNATGATAAMQKGKAFVQKGHQKAWQGVGKAVGLGKYQNPQSGAGNAPSAGGNNQNP